MKKSWKILIIVLAVMGVMAATCPGRQRHIDAQLKFMSKALNKQVKSLEKSYKAEFNQEMEDEGKRLLSQLSESLINQMRPGIEQVFVTRNFVLFSLGQLENETEGKMTVSVGFLGMVFLTNKKEFKTNVNLNT